VKITFTLDCVVRCATSFGGGRRGGAFRSKLNFYICAEVGGWLGREGGERFCVSGRSSGRKKKVTRLKRKKSALGQFATPQNEKITHHDTSDNSLPTNQVICLMGKIKRFVPIATAFASRPSLRSLRRLGKTTLSERKSGSYRMQRWVMW